MSDWIEHLAIPFHYDYMLRAIWVSAWVGGVCGLLSSFVTLKGWSLMGDALSHAVVPGIVIAYLIGLPFVIGAFIAGLLSSASMSLIGKNRKIKEDASLGIVFSAFFAFGLLLISIFPSSIDLKSILYGNLLAITDGDLIQMILISLVSSTFVILKRRDLMLYCFDPNQAKAIGLRVKILHTMLLMVLAAAAIASLQAVGAILVIAMLITPGATAYLLTERFEKMLLISSGFGIVTATLGAYLSYYLNGSTGGCIVTLQTLVFLAVFFLAPKHGLISSRRKKTISSFV